MSTRKRKRGAIAKNLKEKLRIGINQFQAHSSNQNINLSNRFQPLANMEFEDDSININRGSTKKDSTSKPKIPPIVVTQKLFNPNEIQSLELSDISFKFISLGVKISFGIKESYDKCIDHLKKNNVEFFTHRLKNNIFKVILSGLPQLNTDDIKNELNSKYNLNIVDVRELQTSYFNKNSRLYLLSLDNSEINLSHLRQIKVVNHTIINWLRFSPKYKGPIQCRKCLMFGHGAENCHRQTSCMLCASNEHTSENCSLGIADNPLAIYKCGNCQSKGLKSNHKANDPNCPCKLEFQNIRNHVRVKNSNRNNKSNRGGQESPQFRGSNHNRQHHFNINAPEFNQDSFPSLSGNRHQLNYSSTNFGNSYANVTKNNNLLSAEEFFNIFDDALTKFYECKSVHDQFALIASLLRRAIR